MILLRNATLVTLAALFGIANTAVSVAAPREEIEFDVHARGAALTEWLLTGEVDRVYELMSPVLRKAVGGTAGLTALVRRLEEQAGKEVDVLHETAYHERGLVDYYRIARFSDMPNGSITIRWTWRPSGAIVAAKIAPTVEAAPSEHLDYRTKTPLQLPFEGTWYVVWGGLLPHQNYHVVAADQRFAYDFLILRDGQSHVGMGAANEDYYCFGEWIFAPAAGVVTAAVDAIADNTPGVMNEDAPPGNYVVLDHGNGEYSLLAHLRRGSVDVKAGDAVAAGDRLGACGNSGRSSEPHLHYHLQTAPTYGEGVGLPALFRDYFSGRAYRARGKPERGELIHRIIHGDPE